MRAEITRAASLAEHAWVGARERSDFAGFLPYLERNIELRRRYTECFEGFEGFEHPYDPLLDDFEPGMTTEEVRAVLAELRDGVRPLVAEVADRGDPVDDSCLHGDFPVDAQEALAARSWRRLPLEPDAWRLDPPSIRSRPRSPRRTSGSRPGSTPSYIGTALWSVIHEAGHALYENGIASELERSPLCVCAVAGLPRVPEPPVGELGGPRAARTWSASFRAFASCSPTQFGERGRGGALPGGEPDRARR